MALSIKKGDIVKVVSGSNRGAEGKILKIVDDGRRVIVEKVNLKKRRTKPRKQGEKGQVVDTPAPLQISNVLLLCSKCGQGRRFKAQVKGKTKVRVCVKCGSTI